MSRFLNSEFASLEAYVPGEQPQDRKYIKLNTNESPFPPSKRVMDILSSSETEKLNLYPDPEAKELRQAIAGRYGFEPENILVSNGSDEILSFFFMAFCGKGHPVVFPDISYGFYPVYGNLYRSEYTEIPLKADFTIDPADYEAIGKNVVIANPNAPTGIALTVSQIEGIVSSNPDNLVLIDEAYVDFCGGTCVSLVHKYPNLLVVQTYSKSRSLAGGRLGFAIGDRDVIADLNKMRYSTNPYNVNRLTLLCGKAAMEDEEYFNSCVNSIKTVRAYTSEQLRRLGFTVLDSSSNFVFASCGRISGEELYSRLRDRGILVRHFTKERTADYVRITIGTKKQMDALIGAVREILESR